MGDESADPDESALRKFLQDIDPSDEEHGAAWVTDELENSLEFNGDGRLVFSRGEGRPRHIPHASKDFALTCWHLLIQGRLDELEAFPWQPGTRQPLSPEEVAKRQRETEVWQRRQDREFYELLGAESADVSCSFQDCTRGRTAHSVLCRVHCFEKYRGRPCPFDD
jgi:hypothetical protein